MLCGVPAYLLVPNPSVTKTDFKIDWDIDISSAPGSSYEIEWLIEGINFFKRVNLSIQSCFRTSSTVFQIILYNS
jgi:hypothetical protein